MNEKKKKGLLDLAVLNGGVILSNHEAAAVKGGGENQLIGDDDMPDINGG